LCAIWIIAVVIPALTAATCGNSYDFCLAGLIFSLPLHYHRRRQMPSAGLLAYLRGAS